MSAKKNWSLALELTRYADGEHHVAEARTRFKQIASRYIRRAMRRQLDELLVEMQVDRFAEQREREEELRELREWEAVQADLEAYRDQQDDLDEDPYYYDDGYSSDWEPDWSREPAYAADRWDENWGGDDEPSWVAPDRETAERQKDAWLRGRNPRDA